MVPNFAEQDPRYKCIRGCGGREPGILKKRRFNSCWKQETFKLFEQRVSEGRSTGADADINMIDG